MDHKYTNGTIFSYYKDFNENLAWLTQKTEELKRNKGNFTFPTHGVNMMELLNCKVIKKLTSLALRKKCPYSELFWSAFFLHFREKCGAE